VGLEDELRKLMKDSIEGAAPMLEVATGERRPDAPSITVSDEIDILWARTAGLERVVLRLAREIDETRGT
jgi:hypothetical protein